MTAALATSPTLWVLDEINAGRIRVITSGRRYVIPVGELAERARAPFHLRRTDEVAADVLGQDRDAVSGSQA